MSIPLPARRRIRSEMVTRLAISSPHLVACAMVRGSHRIVPQLATESTAIWPRSYHWIGPNWHPAEHPILALDRPTDSPPIQPLLVPQPAPNATSRRPSVPALEWTSFCQLIHP